MKYKIGQEVKVHGIDCKIISYDHQEKLYEVESGEVGMGCDFEHSTGFYEEYEISPII